MPRTGLDPADWFAFELPLLTLAALLALALVARQLPALDAEADEPGPPLLSLAHGT